MLRCCCCRWRCSGAFTHRSRHSCAFSKRCELSAMPLLCRQHSPLLQKVAAARERGLVACAQRVQPPLEVAGEAGLSRCVCAVLAARSVRVTSHERLRTVWRARLRQPSGRCAAPHKLYVCVRLRPVFLPWRLLSVRACPFSCCVSRFHFQESALTPARYLRNTE